MGKSPQNLDHQRPAGQWAAALGHNPMADLDPCHRVVVASDGRLTAFQPRWNPHQAVAARIGRKESCQRKIGLVHFPRPGLGILHFYGSNSVAEVSPFVLVMFRNGVRVLGLLLISLVLRPKFKRQDLWKYLVWD
jgi:hypothetical protein